MHKRKAIEPDAGDLAALMDGAPPAKRGRGNPKGGSRRGGGRGGVQGRRHHRDERTTPWGSALLTYSTKRDGTKVVQATCHRRHAHAPLPGKPSTVCRTTYNVTANHSEEDCVRLCKMWVTKAHDYHTRLRHQGKRFSLDELDNDEELEVHKPPADYNSGDDGDDGGGGGGGGGGGASVVPLARPRPRFRLRRKIPAGVPR